MKLTPNQLRSIKRLSILVASAYALAPNSMAAYDFDGINGGAGINLGITFTEKFKPKMTFGIEAFLVQKISNSYDENGYFTGEPMYAAGSMFQLNHVFAQGWRATYALTAGQSNSYGELAVMGELGATYRFKQQDWGMRVGALFEPMNATFSARHDFSFKETAFTTGLRLPGTFGGIYSPVTVVEGRPLRTENNDQLRQTRNVINSVADKWADMAQDEFEAIFAFGNLAFELMAAGAPQNLIDQALDSAEQEIKHAQYAAKQAHSFDESFELQAPEDLFRAPLQGVDALSRLALEGLVDGWQGEGLAAKTMQAGAKSAKDKQVSQNLMQIASEETGHAKLGSDIARWAVNADITGVVREQVAALNKSDLGSLQDSFSDAGAGFIGSRQVQSLSEQVRDGLNVEIDHILKS